MKKLGILTIGQSPRPDILQELQAIFGNAIERMETGALDGMSNSEIEKLRPDEGERMLVTRLSDGSEIHIAEEKLMNCMQKKICCLEEKGAGAILILCTADFHGLHSTVPLIEPRKILNAVIPRLSPRSAIGVLSPDNQQVEATKRDWQGIVGHIEVLTASPYGKKEELESAAKVFRSKDLDLIVLDCMGYTESARKRIEELSGKPVILSKALAAKAAVDVLEGK